MEGDLGSTAYQSQNSTARSQLSGFSFHTNLMFNKSQSIKDNKNYNLYFFLLSLGDKVIIIFELDIEIKIQITSIVLAIQLAILR